MYNSIKFKRKTDIARKTTAKILHGYLIYRLSDQIVKSA